MCFFMCVCVLRVARGVWGEGGGGAVFGSLVLFGSYSAKEAQLSSLMPPPSSLISPFTLQGRKPSWH